MRQIYLDNAATTSLDSRVLEEMLPYLKEDYGNPSSKHALGEKAMKVLERSREIIANSINARVSDIIFTSGGTESNNLAFKGAFFSNYPEKNHIITTKIEHDSILRVCKWLEKQGAKVTYLNVDKEGFVNPKDVEDYITDKTFLVSIIHTNNEIGTIQNLEEIGKICKNKEILFHTDSCQSFTKTNLDVKKQNLNLVTLNAHKIHGPKGVGALYVKSGTKITPLLHGGGHERNLRSGTENVPGIVGFAKAIEITKDSDIRKMGKSRDNLIKELLKIENTRLNGPIQNRICNIINISFNNIEGEAIGGYLQEAGIYTSTGSACLSNKSESSHVLKAIGLNNKEANSSLRISLSKYNTEKEIDYFIKKLRVIVERLRKLSPIID